MHTTASSPAVKIRTAVATTAIGAVVTAMVCVATVHASTNIPGGRPSLRVESEAQGCPGVDGAYVALLDPARGILLLSAAPFPGGSPAGTAAGRPMTVGVAHSQPWHVSRIGDASAPIRVWAVHYAFRGEALRGCVGFDKDRFSAAGDLASYVHWLVGSVYAHLPQAERESSPAFRLSNRGVRLRVSHHGLGTVDLKGKEGATLACRFGNEDRIFLVIPFVLDQAEERVAVEVGFTDQPYWEAGEKTMTGFFVASPGTPVSVPDVGLEIAVLDVASPH
jgi:hypothetical protein